MAEYVCCCYDSAPLSQDEWNEVIRSRDDYQTGPRHQALNPPHPFLGSKSATIFVAQITSHNNLKTALLKNCSAEELIGLAARVRPNSMQARLPAAGVPA